MPDTITNYTVFACDVNSQHRKSMDYKIVDVNSLPLHHVHINKLYTYSLETKLLSDDKFYSPTQYPNHPLAIYQVRSILCHDCRNSYIFLGVTKVLCVPGFQWKVDVHTQINDFFMSAALALKRAISSIVIDESSLSSRPCPVFCHLQCLTANNENLGG